MTVYKTEDGIYVNANLIEYLKIENITAEDAESDSGNFQITAYFSNKRFVSEEYEHESVDKLCLKSFGYNDSSKNNDAVHQANAYLHKSTGTDDFEVKRISGTEVLISQSIRVLFDSVSRDIVLTEEKINDALTRFKNGEFNDLKEYFLRKSSGNLSASEKEERKANSIEFLEYSLKMLKANGSTVSGYDKAKADAEAWLDNFVKDYMA
ncbi:MAG TPA: hypothetical protein O0X97_00520 [Methanocorpusculum sp.]|nr:hypothetical protein [Methanocorpusculum sp.]